jgi:predicted dehydrogenase
MANEKIRVGYIGAGANTRKYHIPLMAKQPGVELVTVANRSKESSEKVAKEFGIPRVSADWREVIADRSVDAICIGTWPYTHAEMTIAALEAGKHVLCEARMAMNAVEGRQMLAASRRHPNLVAQIVPSPFTLEVDATLTRLLGERAVGDVLAVELCSSQAGRFGDASAPMHWRQDVRLSGHNVLNMGIWYEAMMRWLGPVSRVMAIGKIVVPQRRDEGGVLRSVQVPDHVEIIANFGVGPVGRMRFSGFAALAPSNEAWIFGSEGTIKLEADAKRVLVGKRGETALKEVDIPAAQRIGWRVEESFVNAIRGTEKVTRTNFEDGVRYMEFTDAVAQSMASGQAVAVREL